MSRWTRWNRTKSTRGGWKDLGGAKWDKPELMNLVPYCVDSSGPDPPSWSPEQTDLGQILASGFTYLCLSHSHPHSSQSSLWSAHNAAWINLLRLPARLSSPSASFWTFWLFCRRPKAPNHTVLSCSRHAWTQLITTSRQRLQDRKLSFSVQRGVPFVSYTPVCLQDYTEERPNWFLMKWKTTYSWLRWPKVKDQGHS